MLRSLAVLGLLPVALTAQPITFGRPAPGARVRVVSSCVVPNASPGRQPSPNRVDRQELCARYQGIMTQLTPDSMSILIERDTVTLARSTIRSIEVRVGTRGNAPVGAAIGGAVGLAAGLVSAAATDCEDDLLRDLCTTGQVAAPIVAAGLGAGLGALVGMLVRSDRWEHVTLR